MVTKLRFHPDFLLAFFYAIVFHTLASIPITWRHMEEVGVTLFVVIPIVLGVFVGRMSRAKPALGGLAAAYLVFYGALGLFGMESLACVLLSLPIALLLTAIGFGIGRYWRRKRSVEPGEAPLNMLLLPVLVVLFSFGGEWMLDKTRTEKREVVETTVFLPHPPEQVWDAIKEVPYMEAEKPLLLKLGLPVPKYCKLTAEAVGGIRTCYFEGGHIQERLTVVDKPRLLRMEVTAYKLTGRNWLRFHEAEYRFEPKDGGTLLTRGTTYSSELVPRLYWEPLERWGIQSEHTYVLRNLARDLANAPRPN